MRLFGMTAAVALGLAGFVASGFLAEANAATITETVNFIAKDFHAQGGGTAPVDPVSGSFTFTLDPSKSYTNQSGVITNYLDIKADGPVLFSYDPTQQWMTIGAHNLSNPYTWGTNDFSLSLFLNDPKTGGFFGYSQAGIHDSFITYDVALSTKVAATPLPGSLLMLGTALAALAGFGWMMRKRGGGAATLAPVPA